MNRPGFSENWAAPTPERGVSLAPGQRFVQEPLDVADED